MPADALESGIYPAVDKGNMTQRVEITESQRPRRLLGAFLREHLHCPLCGGECRIVAYRTRTCRLECEGCELRFSLDAMAVGRIMRDNAEELLDRITAANPRRGMAMGVALLAVGANPTDTESFKAAAVEQMATMGSAIFSLEQHAHTKGRTG